MLLATLAGLATPAGYKGLTLGVQMLDRADKRIRLRLGMPLRGTPDLDRLSERHLREVLKTDIDPYLEFIGIIKMNCICGEFVIHIKHEFTARHSQASHNNTGCRRTYFHAV